MMRRFFGKVWSSSQPTIKQEAEENEAPGMFDVYFWNETFGGDLHTVDWDLVEPG
jgi:hypothetical protein